MPVTRPKIRTDLTVAELDGESVVYDERTGHLHYLNATATLVFNLCDGTATMRESAADVAHVYSMPEEEVEQQIRALVRRFRRVGLLEGTGLSPRKAAGNGSAG